jgi:uncharacterized repeat protein (TIGR01451 family)
MDAVRSLAVLWIVAVPVSGQDECPAPDVIADLPAPPICDTTCGKSDRMPMYSGTVSCTIQGDPYPGGDMVHEVFLNNVGEGPDNAVGFRLESPDGDLALILVRADGVCIANSPDFIGIGVVEAIPAANYRPSGLYSLYVDSALGASCGSYCLRVTGANPPQRDLRIGAATKPEEVTDVVAGTRKGRRNLTHTITVANPGPFLARGLELRVGLTLPPGTSLEASNPRLVGDIWRVGTLCPDQERTLTLFFNVGSSTADGAVVGSTAEIIAVEPEEPNFGDQESLPLTTSVSRQVDLYLETKAPESVIAGSGPAAPCPGNLCHTLTVRNDGPSDASGLVLEAELECPENVRLIAPRTIANCNKATVQFSLGDLAAGEEKSRRLAFNVLSSAPEDGVIRSTATVTVNETNHGDTGAVGMTSIRRRVDLRISQQSTPTGTVVAGSCEGTQSVPTVLRWRGTVRNLGPSDASAVRLDLALTSGPDGVGKPVTTAGAGASFADSEWIIPALPAGGSEVLRTELTVGPDARDGDAITHTLTLKDVAEEDRLGDDESSRTVVVERRVDLKLEADPEPPGDVVAGKDDDYPNLRYRVTLRNDGPSEAADVEVAQSLTFPAWGVRLDDIRPTPGGYVAGRTDLVWKPLALSPTCGSGSPQANLEIDLTVGPSAPNGGEITYGDFAIRANGGACTGKPCDADVPQDARTTIRRELGFFLEHGFSSDRVVAGKGEDLTYDVMLTNDGPSDASGVTVVLPPLALPEGVTVEDPSILDGDTWLIGDLRRGKMATLTRALTVRASTSAGSKIIEKCSPTVSAVEDDDPPVERPSEQISMVVVVAETDLEPTFEPLTEPAFAGGNVVYELTVRNDGPSDSTGATVCTSLPAGLEFVASPDDCRADADLAECGDGGVAGARCAVGPLPAPDDEDENENEKVLRFVVALDPDLEAGTVTSTARAVANETDEDGGEATLDVGVALAADLALGVGDAPDPVVDLELLRYTLTVTNRGPSNATEVKTCGRLPPATVLDDASDPECRLASPEDECEDVDGEGMAFRCGFGELAAGAEEVSAVLVSLVSPDEALVLRAKASGAEDDPVPENDAAEEVTTVAEAEDADLGVAQSAAPDPAIAGRPLTYTITVRNRGPAPLATGVVLRDALPEGVAAPGILPAGCAEEEEEEEGQVIVRCDIDALGKDEERVFELTVDVPAMDGSLRNRVEVGFDAEDGEPQDDPNDDPDDPNFNNASELETAILRVDPLVVPYFGGTKTAFAVRNAEDEPITVRYEAVGPVEAPLARVASIVGHATRAVVLGDGPSEGYVGIGPDPDTPQPEIPVDALSGDYFRLRPGSASGALLVDTDPCRVPAGLCRRPRAGFINGELGETDFVFFVPNNPGGDEPTGTGRVYGLDGRFVQELEVPSSMGDAFELDSREDFDVLARAGTVEWTFREGVVGHVVGIWRRGNAAVAIPAVCPEPETAASCLQPDLPEEGRPTPHLLLPFFEIGDGVTTVLGVHNAAQEEARLRYEYFEPNPDDSEGPVVETLPLKGRGTRLVDLGSVPGLAPPPGKGFVHVTAVDRDDEPLADAQLHGEWLRLGADGELASGEALVDGRASLRPPGLCLAWNARFFNGAVGATTDFIFYVEEGAGPMLLVGQVYGQGGGGPVGQVHLTGERALMKNVTELTLDGGEDAIRIKSGAIEWTFQGDRRGYVATIHRAGDLSVAVPAVCRDGAGEDP